MNNKCFCGRKHKEDHVIWAVSIPIEITCIHCASTGFMWVSERNSIKCSFCFENGVPSIPFSELR